MGGGGRRVRADAGRDAPRARAGVRRAPGRRTVWRGICWPPRSPIRWWFSGSPGACGCGRRGRSRGTGRGGCYEAAGKVDGATDHPARADAARAAGRGRRRAGMADARPPGPAERAFRAARRGEPRQPAADPAGARGHHRPSRPAAGRQSSELPDHHGARAGRGRRGGARPAGPDRGDPARPARAGAEGDGEPQRLRAGRGGRAPDLGRHRAGRGERADPAGGDPGGRA